MENFIVSARKYRPATFDTVVGQQNITNTLKNAIRNNHLAQAFLFCGPRGVGKTTCARILAKTINCFNRTPEGEACGQCESCVSFQEGQSLNIYELDAASNNSVDDIRALVDQVRFAPQLGKYKVYIIDEVHMLSTSAFNAFLKTLEEPPKHAIFILATTEKHKIIPTILSRCQIFDFNRIDIKDIAKHLTKIGLNEGIETEYDGLMQIAAKADGGLRDALSMFDQIVTCSGSVTYKAVIDNLNILDYDYYFRVTDNILKQDITHTLLVFNEILSNGFDGNHFIIGLAEHFRNLLVCKDEATLTLLEVSEHTRDKYKHQSHACSQQFLINALSICNKCDLNYKISKNQRLHVELALLQLCSNAQSPFYGDEKKNFNDLIPPPYLSKAGPGKSTTPASPPVATPTIAAPVEMKTEILAKTKVVQPEVNYPVIEIEKGVPVKAPQLRKGLIQNNPSIKDLRNGITQKAKQEVAEVSQSLVAEPETARNFTEGELMSVWSRYAEILNQKGEVNLYNTISHNIPVLREGHLIEITLSNKLQEKDFNDNKLDLITFLKKELDNYALKIVTKVDETIVKTTSLTSNDKLKQMIEKNPLLAKLRQNLDLDLEY